CCCAERMRQSLPRCKDKQVRPISARIRCFCAELSLTLLQCIAMLGTHRTTAVAAIRCRYVNTQTQQVTVTDEDFRSLALGNAATPKLLRELERAPFDNFETHIEGVRGCKCRVYVVA